MTNSADEDKTKSPVDMASDAEGVWSPDIEQSFQEALAIYPPCGRRKIILSDEGKMYGRNELIARYIKLRTGKTRTRKQDQAARDKALQTMASMSSAQIVSASVLHNKNLGASNFGGNDNQSFPPLRLLEFSAFLEQQTVDPETYHKHLFVHLGPNTNFSDPLLEAVDIRQIYDKFPEKKGGLKELYDKGPQSVFFLVKFWADLNTSIQDEAGAFYGVSSTYESSENMTITCSTKVCSFGKQVVEKVETEYGHFENGSFFYRIHRSPMCEYMLNFIHKLKQLPEKYMMNSVLENFTILQILDTELGFLCEMPNFTTMYADIDAVLDFPPCFVWEEILRCFPDAKVIIQERDNGDVWLRSYLKTVELMELARNQWWTLLGFTVTPSGRKWKRLIDLEILWHGNWDPKFLLELYAEHNSRVKALVPRDKLLVYNIKQGWEPLCTFLGVQVPDKPFPRLNVKSSSIPDETNQSISGRRMFNELVFVLAVITGSRDTQINSLQEFQYFVI
ncbi:hypothetical protein QZH41_000171 [Actinostola sp. cb2023]|nr:hypothetical protein QZH41_000171 [Actinostola sp. cb2023]